MPHTLKILCRKICKKTITKIVSTCKIKVYSAHFLVKFYVTVLQSSELSNLMYSDIAMSLSKTTPLAHRIDVAARIPQRHPSRAHCWWTRVNIARPRHWLEEVWWICAGRPAPADARPPLDPAVVFNKNVRLARRRRATHLAWRQAKRGAYALPSPLANSRSS